MVNPRRYSDEELGAALEGSSTWRQVLLALGRNPKGSTESIKDVADRLSLDYSHLPGFDREELKEPGFTAANAFPAKSISVRNFQLEAQAHAISWFTARGYATSLPTQPVAYDLVAESAIGLQRIQVKSSQSREASTGHYIVRLVKSSYVAAGGGRPGRYVQIPYGEDELDWFFVYCADGSTFLIPQRVVLRKATITVTRKYASFRV